MNILDRAIEVVAPAAALRREEARARLELARGGQTRMVYEGAARSHRTGFRRFPASSANTELWQSLWQLRDVSRNYTRNNPYAANVVAKIPSNVVGAGIIPAVVSTNKRRKKALQDLVIEHLDTPAIDFDGRSNLYALQSLAARCMVEAGEALLVRYVPPAALKLSVPLQVRVLEPDYLDSTKHGAIDSGNFCFMGIEFDKNGRRVAYWIYDEHPGGTFGWKLPTSSRVAAQDVIHLYRVDRAGQARGIPWGAPCFVTMGDLGEWWDARLMREKIASCFTVFITGGDAPNLARSASERVSNEKTRAGTPLEVVEPGLIERLPSGVEVKFASPPQPAGEEAFMRLGARQIAIGYGVPYEIATGDMSQVSFISGRLGLLQFGRDIDQWRWHALIPHVCAGIGSWFLEAARIPLGGPAQARLDWTPPRRELVDPKSEVPAEIDAIRGGLWSRSESNRKSGFDPEEVEREVSEENQRTDDLKNVRFDSDGRFPKNTRGMEQVSTPDEGGTPPPAPASGGPNGQNAAR